MRILIVIYLLLTLSCSNEKYDDTYLKITQLSLLNLLLNPLRTSSSIEVLDFQTMQSHPASNDLLPVGLGSSNNLLDSDRIAIFGGSNLDSYEPIKDVYVYNLKNNKIDLKLNLKYARSFHSVTKGQDGAFYIVGGRNTRLENDLVDLPVEKFDALDGTIVQVGTIINQRRSHKSILLDDGKILLIGGYSGKTRNAIGSLEKFDPVTGTSTAVGSLLIPRAEFEIFREGNSLFVFGGHQFIDSKLTLIPEIEKIDLTSLSSQIINSLQKPRGGYSSIKLSSMLYIIGGVTASENILYESEGINLTTGEKSTLEGTLITSTGTCVMNFGNSNYIGYGLDLNSKKSSKISEINLMNGKSTSLFSGLVERQYPSCVKIKEGKYLIFGGI